MDTDVAMHLLAQTLLTAAKVSAPILVATLLVGVVISIVQVVTQIQEMTLTFIPKLVVVVMMFVMTGAWMMAVVVEFTRHLFGLVAGM
ncbi:MULTISPECIES: flagellar biosynthetic protein FliQ [Dyella]|uniref:flagellar biosynthetic protein FliQ n=1 Tax=Dyella TaxID=231454 RepID=UPI003CF036DF